MQDNEEEPGNVSRDAEDFSALPDAETSAPGTVGEISKATARLIEAGLEASDPLPKLPAFAEEMGGLILSASDAEAESRLPKQFRALLPQARQACRFRAGGMRVAMIAKLMGYAPGSISAMLCKQLAKDYREYLGEKQDDKVATVQEGMQLLSLKALDRLTGIIHESTNDGLVAKCSFQLFDRVGLKPAERLIVEDNRAITNEDLANAAGLDAELTNVLKQE